MRQLANALSYIFAVGVGIYAAVVYGLFPLGAAVHPAMKVSFVTHAAGIYTHVFASIVALVLGPFQLSTKLRAMNPVLHRWSGRAYLTVGVLIGGVSGLYVAQFAFGGMVSRLGFSVLALGWLFTGFMAYRAILRRNIAQHRRWMVRNFALTFAAVTLRVYLGLFFATGAKFEDFYPSLAWIAWIPNLLFAEWYLYSERASAPG